MDLRKSFWDTILEMARKDKKIIVLIGDVGFSYYEKFEKELPSQFINCGIAEQNMIGVAAGLALGGFKPYVYSNAVFLLMRPYEFIRDDICYNNLPVKLIGTGAADFLGFSHNLVEGEDKQILAKLPNIKTFFPKSGNRMKDILTTKGLIYVKL